MKSKGILHTRNYCNILDYLYKERDVSFDESSFNDIDAAVLGAFSYISFEEFEKNGVEYKPKTIAELSKDYLSYTTIDYMISLPDWMKKSVFLAMALLSGRRFSAKKVTAFKCILSEETKIQFAALNIKIDENISVIAFRGTDNTILGWREDFELACFDEVGSQKEALEFINECMKENPEDRFYVLGHSKGGNLALYGSCLCDDPSRIIKVISLDGPGLNKKMFESNEYKTIKNKLTHIIVKDDLIGRLLMHDKESYVVDAIPEHDFMMQHDIYNWRVDGKRFITVNETSEESDYLSKGFAEWLETEVSDVSMRSKIVDSLFQAQAKTEFTDPGKIIDDPMKFLSQMRKAIAKENKEERALLNKAVWSLVSVYIRIIPDELKAKKAKKNKKMEMMEADIDGKESW